MRILFAAAVLMVLSVSAQAQTSNVRYYSTPWGPVFTSRDECDKAGAMPDMRVLDRNRDGVISAREFEGYGAGDLTVSMFYSIDKNHDGRVTRQELDAYRHVGKCETQAY